MSRRPVFASSTRPAQTRSSTGSICDTASSATTNPAGCVRRRATQSPSKLSGVVVLDPRPLLPGPEINRLLSFAGVAPISTAAPLFGEQAHAAHLHGGIQGLGHVVDGQQTHLHSGEGLHFHTRPGMGVDRGLHPQGRLVGHGADLHLHPVDGQGVTEGDQLPGAFGGLDGGNAGHGQHVPLGHLSRGNPLQHLGSHTNPPLRQGLAVGGWALHHGDHVGLPLGIEMGEFHG